MKKGTWRDLLKLLSELLPNRRCYDPMIVIKSLKRKRRSASAHIHREAKRPRTHTGRTSNDRLYVLKLHKQGSNVQQVMLNQHAEATQAVRDSSESLPIKIQTIHAQCIKSTCM